MPSNPHSPQPAAGRRTAFCALASCVIAVALAVLPAAAQDAGEFRPAVSMLPDSTQGMVSIDDLPQLLEHWTRTSLSDLQHEESLQPFLEAQREMIEQRLAESGLRAGLRLEDLRDAVSGELVLAWMRYEAPRRPYTIALLADTRGRDAARQELLDKIDAGLRQRDASVESVELGGEQATLYTLPRKRGQLIIERLLVANVDDRLIVTDRPETMESLVAASRQGVKNGLAQAVDYQGVFAALAKGDSAETDQPGSLRWFARPLGMAEIVRDAAGVDRGRQVDVIKLLRNQGFAAVQSAGGHVRLATDAYDLLHRAFIFAPPTVEGPERYQLAARALQFPNGEMGAPPGWVLPSAATLFQAHWKMEEAFWAVETLVDEAFGEKIYRKVIEDIREDVEGPQIDIAGDVVANFDDHLLVFTDNRIVEGESRERVLGAIRLKQMDVVAQSINKAMSGDPDVYRLPYENHLIWEIRPSEAEVADFDIEGFEDFGFEDPQDLADANRNQPLLERWALTVYGDHLIFASHADLLVEIIEHEQTGGPTIANSPAFQRVRDAIAALGGETRAMERILLTDLAWQVKYELVRQGKFLQSDSLLANLLQRLKEEADEAEDREPLEIDTSKLPPFAEIRHHLQPAGGFMRTEPQGWSITNFLLRKPE